MSNWEMESKYYDEYRKSVTLGGNLYPRGKRKEVYDLKYDLAFGHITFEEYNAKMEKLKENDS